MHGFPSSQFVVPVQAPALHVSPVVHELPSLQALPVRGVPLQTLAVSSQEAVLHWSPDAEQSRAVPPVQAPAALHFSVTVQNRPSSHAEPTGSLASQVSVASLQLSLQFPSPSAPGQGGTAACTLQTPPLQVSAPLQKRVSSQVVPV